MDSAVDWLDKNDGAIQVILVFLLVVVTAFYAWRTHVMAGATKALAESTESQARATASLAQATEFAYLEPFRPRVVMDVTSRKLDSNPGPPILITVRAVNRGKGTARDVLITCQSADYGYSEGGLGHHGPGTQGEVEISRGDRTSKGKIRNTMATLVAKYQDDERNEYETRTDFTFDGEIKLGPPRHRRLGS